MTPSPRNTLLPLIVLLAPLLAAPAAAEPSSVTIRVRPDPVYMERVGDRQFFSFELELLDGGKAPLDLAAASR